MHPDDTLGCNLSSTLCYLMWENVVHPVQSDGGAVRHASAGVLQCVHGRALKRDSGMPVQAAPSSAVKSIKCLARLDAIGGQRCSFQPQLRSRTVSARCVAAIGVEITEGPHRHFVTPEGVEVFILGVEHCVKQPHLGAFYRLLALQFKTPSP